MIKVGDFGLATQLDNARSRRVTMCGTSWYMGPEVFDKGAVLKSDVWSLGISLIEMAEGKNPYVSMTSMMIMKRVVEEAPPSLSSSDWSYDFVDFVKQCLIKDVEKRPSVDELMRVSETERSDA